MRKVPTYFHFLPFVVLYFFFNNILLPEGLLMTTLLTPVFVYWLYKKKQMTPLAKWSILLLLPLLFHMFIGFDFKSYFISTVLILSAWIFLFTALKASADIAEDMEGIFHKILVLNTFLIAMALLILPFPFLRDCCWYSKPISVGIEAFPRLKLFAYESSHYALLISPVVLFFLLKVIMGKSKHPLIYISLSMLPMVLSLSFGVLGALLMALLMGMVLFHKKLPKVSALYASIAVMSMLLLLGFALWLWPDNPISIRLENIFSGKDTSANGRLFDSFMFANDMISTQSAWLGVGPGQVKILAHDMIIDHYKYTGELAEVVRIPNSMGEMLAIYGWYGFIVKIALEIFFFIRLKIYQNIYSFSLFVFIFIYQFTGSFLMNIAEIGIWAIVFQGRFQSFSNSKKPNEL